MRLGGVAKALLAVPAVVALSVLGVQPANAASTYIQVCISSDSQAHTFIEVWKVDSGYSNYLYEDDPNDRCTGDLYNANDSVRVDTKSSSTYKIKPIGIGYSGTYGPCHYGNNSASNPPNASLVYYKINADC